MGALLALALLAAGPSDVTVAHKRVVVNGVGLGLYRYTPPGNGAGHRPVLLIPDLGFSRKVFDLYGRGLARWLSDKGYLVYVGEVRGQGTADPGDSLAAITTDDVPALLEAISQEQPGPIDVVVQGWAGTLVLAGLPRGAEAQVGRVVAINTPALPEVPSRVVGRFLAEGGRFLELTASPEGRHALDLMLSMGGRFPERSLDTVRAAGMRDLSPKAASALLEWMTTGALSLGGDDSIAKRLASYDRPTLQLLALADGFANPELCAPLRDLVPARVKVHTFSRMEAAEDYSHLSVLVGSHAERDVFPLIERFFTEPAE